ncbi:MFP1 attachment factor 1-like [Pyrus ussuriensis x Pyrus communis]|uniref:MFP1 attachment factor 1-like n=1 Tax=Pyrus ussuriensis x Pyrus communis TaxID=2448454 RepID=A0A5N5FT57_9ROSA|nr:MFP1 attachment factor 1-like [Pyrus ussuriensis x Pyrus communis]
MERSVLFGLSILTGGSNGRFHRRACGLKLRGAVLSSGSNGVPRLDGVEHAFANLLGMVVGVAGFCKSGSLGCQIETARER